MDSIILTISLTKREGLHIELSEIGYSIADDPIQLLAKQKNNANCVVN